MTSGHLTLRQFREDLDKIIDKYLKITNKKNELEREFACLQRELEEIDKIQDENSRIRESYKKARENIDEENSRLCKLTMEREKISKMENLKEYIDKSSVKELDRQIDSLKSVVEYYQKILFEPEPSYEDREEEKQLVIKKIKELLPIVPRKICVNCQEYLKYDSCGRPISHQDTGSNSWVFVYKCDLKEEIVNIPIYKLKQIARDLAR